MLQHTHRAPPISNGVLVQQPHRHQIVRASVMAADQMTAAELESLIRKKSQEVSEAEAGRAEQHAFHNADNVVVEITCIYVLDGKERQDELHASLTVVEGNLRARVDTAEERMRAAEARALEMEEEAEDLARALMAERKNRG